MGKRILVIEPSRPIRSILLLYFKQGGHQVVLFEDYQAAIQALPRLQREPPDLVFVALRVNRPDSFHVVTVLRKLYTQVRLVLLVMQEESKRLAVQRLVGTTQAIALLKPFTIKEGLSLVAASV